MKAEKSLKIYNASAGSGKTYTLVQEYLRLILKDDNPKNFTQVLAMTFTNKAANEMKERVIEKLTELAVPIDKKTSKESSECEKYAAQINLNKEVITERAAKSLNSILHNYGMFSVMTIDKFTHRVIRTFAKELGLSIDFDVELDLTALKQRIADLLFEQIGRDPELTDLMVHYAKTKLQDDKSWNFSQSLVDFTKILFQEDAQEAIQALTKLAPKDFIAIQQQLQEEQKTIISKLKKCGEEFLAFMNRNGLEKSDFYFGANGFVSVFYALAQGEIKDKHPSGRALTAADGGKLAGSGPNASIVDSFSTDIYAFLNQAIELLEDSKARFYLNQNLLKNINNLSLLNHLMNMVESIKEEDNILLISDFYKRIAEVIVDEPVPFIYERLGVRYRHFLLDEFQDTSKLQWMNLIPLVHNSLAQKHTNLIVGDGKQAIYRWRNGDVDQFIKLPNYLTAQDSVASIAEARQTFAQEGEVQVLESNYRSSPVIVNFNNEFFEKLIAQQSDYIKAIYHNSSQEPKQQFPGLVRANFKLDFEQEDQAVEVLKIIRETLSKGYDLKDIAILSRRNSESSFLANYLTLNGIKVTSPDSLHVGNDAAVKLLAATIKAVLYPNNKNAKIKLLEHYSALSDHRVLNVEVADKSAFEVMDELAVQVAPYEHFNSLYSYVEHLVAAFKLELNGNPYLLHFLEIVHQFEKKNGFKIQGFLTWFNGVGRKKSISNPEGANAVQIMTIHKSKGLQFPIVIFPFMDWDTEKNKNEVWIHDEKQLIPSFTLTPSTKTKLTHYKEELEDEENRHLLDHINVIYVGLTRPEKALFLMGSTGKEKVGTNLVSNLLMTKVLDQIEGLQHEDGIWQVGELAQNEEDNQVIQAYQFDIIRDVLEPSKLSLQDLDTELRDRIDERKRFGNNLHLILSELENLSQTDEVVNRLVAKGKIEEADTDDLVDLLERLKANERFQFYFNGLALNEKEIVDEMGKKHVPDKIIFTDEAIIVVDFKTGEPHSEKHAEQVSNYIDLVKDIFPDRPVKGELFYTQEQQFISVPAE